MENKRKNKTIALVLACSLALGNLPALAVEQGAGEQAAAQSGQWMTGEYHVHTRQSNDATSPFMKLENVLAVAFRNTAAMAQMDPAACVSNIEYGAAFDYLFLADHLRRSVADANGNDNGASLTPRYVAIGQQQEKIAQLQEQGLYNDQILYSGFEWDMPGLDHATVGIIDGESDEIPLAGIHEFEWLYADQKEDPDTLFVGDTADDGQDLNEEEAFGPRKSTTSENGNGRANVDNAYDGIRWLLENYPDSYALPNHPSRHAGAGGEVTIEHLRKLNDIAPEIVFGMEGMPGNQMAGSTRGELPNIYNGADEMIAKTGGVWDALLSEGRRFWNFANSDFHFKVSGDEKYSSGYWPSEYSRNHTYVTPGPDGEYDYKDVVEGLRSGNSYSVYGELIDELDFTLKSAESSATMGQSLPVEQGDLVTVTIKFQIPAQNNYATIKGSNTGMDVSNAPALDHVDLIRGSVTGKVAESEYASVQSDAAIVKTFAQADLGQPDAEGFYTLTYQAPATGDSYYRVRGTTVSDVDANGDPLADAVYEGTSNNGLRFDQINDQNYSSLCFYSNPIFIEAAPRQSGFENLGTLPLNLVGRYTSGDFNVDGGVMEIVAYNPQNGFAYGVNGQSGKLAITPLKGLGSDVAQLTATEFDMKAAIAEQNPTFSYGDMTSVAVSPNGSILAVALQSSDYSAPGYAAFFTCNSNGSLGFQTMVQTGVQPDMVTFANDTTALTADEGEPRQGYDPGAVDPKGSVTLINLATGTGTLVDFADFDTAEQRDALVQKGVLLKKGANPSVDLEPEYIAVAGDKAYISLQEANAIAILDLATQKFTGIASAGFIDHSTTPIDLDKKDEAYAPKTYASLRGIAMPDAISAYQVGGKTYLVTANEGDSRDWNGYTNEAEVNFGKGGTSPTGAITAASGLTGKVVFYDASTADGLEADKDYVFGGRSFSILEVAGNTLTPVYNSGAEFEKKTAQYLPSYFNASNDNATLDDRSGKKGPEPEGITLGKVAGKTYAFIALERTGGLMVYDVTTPSQASFVNYINTRDFTTQVPGSVSGDKFVTGGDVAPEGLSFVPAEKSPTGYPLVLAAHEVSGTLAVYQINAGRYTGPTDDGWDSTPSTGTGSGTGSTTNTTTNADGSVTKTTTNASTGTVTQLTTYSDGATYQVITQKDGSTETKQTRKDGLVATSSTSAAGVTTATITLPSGMESATVAIPVQAVSATTVAYLVGANGSETLLTNCVPSKGIGPMAPQASTQSPAQQPTLLVQVQGNATLRIAQNTASFADIASGAWYEDPVAFVTSRQLFQGLGGGNFGPQQTMDRAMLATVLWRMAGSPAATGSSFADVPANSWYAQAVAWASAQGIVTGDGSGFAPLGNLTRQQLATMLFRYAEATEFNAKSSQDLGKFSDADQSAPWAQEALAWACGQGILSGRTDGTLDPAGIATRAEVSAMLQRYITASIQG